MRPAYLYGPGKTQSMLFACPVAAIPAMVWDTLALWNVCRLTGTLPHAGGLFDQPMVVQRYFPFIESQWRLAERTQDSNRTVHQMATGLAMALGGGQKR